VEVELPNGVKIKTVINENNKRKNGRKIMVEKMVKITNKIVILQRNS